MPIRLFGDPVLRTAAAPVTDFDKELRTLVADLTETMLEAPRGGGAGAQRRRGPRVNPALSLSAETQDGQEGCLSLPGLTLDCRRALSVVARGFDVHGE